MKRILMFIFFLNVSLVTLNAIRVICTNLELECYHANRRVIDSLLNFQSKEDIMAIKNRYYVPDKDSACLERMVVNRDFRLICHDFLYRDSLEKRVRNKMYIKEMFRDSINTLLIPAYSNHVSGENLSYALHYSTALKLDSVQYSYIMQKALDMARRIRKNYKVNLWNEEMEILKNTLDKRQLNSFFVRKNSEKVTEEFDKAWKRLDDAGLSEQLDSAKDANAAVNYMFSRQMIKDLYRGYGTSQKKYLAELEKKKPKMISLLEGLDKKILIKEENKKNIGKEFIW